MTSIRRRDSPVLMGPGEFIDPRDAPRVVAWKRVLDIAAEEWPEFLPSLLEHPEDDAAASWITSWHLPADGYEGSLIADFAEETRRYHRVIRASEGIDPEPGFVIGPGYLRPRLGYEGLWKLNGRDYPVSVDPHGVALEPLLRDTETLSLLRWNPFHETRAEATERLRAYLDIALDEVERHTAEGVPPDGALDGPLRTPKVARRHIVWFIRWKFFNRESIYKIAETAVVSESAVRHALDRVADVLEWGHRMGKLDGHFYFIP